MAVSLRNHALQKLNIYKRNFNIKSYSQHLRREYHAISTYLLLQNSKNTKFLRLRNALFPLHRLQSTSSLGLSSTLDGGNKEQTVSNFITAVNGFKEEGALSNATVIETTDASTTDLIKNVGNLSENGATNGIETSINGVHAEAINGALVNETSTNGVDILIPEPPPLPPSLTEEIITSEVGTEALNTLTSVGLGGWLPPGIVQQCLNFLQESGSLPWWLAIFVGTLTVRLAMFPMVIFTQRNAAHVSNHMPQMNLLQAKMSDARRTGDHIETARYANELMKFVTEKKINPLKSMLMPLTQAPIFISFFIGLRQMANLPLESMKTGGMYWFTDLTLADPYYILPLMTSLTLAITIEVGADGIKMDSLKTAKYVLRAMPIIIFPFTLNFPAAILCYWLSSNIISLAQVSLLKIPTVREYFKIPVITTHSQELKKKQQKGFIEGVKESYTNAKITRELEERARIDEVMFKRSGTGPVPKTYPYNPAKQKLKDNNAVLTKKR